MRRFLALAVLMLFTGCGLLSPSAETVVEPLPAEAPETVVEPLPTGRPYIALIINDMDDEFWQTALSGAQDAARKHGADLFCDAPSASETQSDVLERVLSKGASAVLVAVPEKDLDAAQLDTAQRESVPVAALGMESAEGLHSAFVSSVLTDGYASGELAAVSMFGNHAFVERIRNAREANPVTIAVLAADSGSRAVDERIRGFIDKAAELAGNINSSGAQVTGHLRYAAPVSGAAVNLEVVMAQSGSGLEAAAKTALENSIGLAGIFCAEQSAAEGLLSAAADGADLDAARGKYKDLTVIGYGAGKAQKEAVRNQYFHGAIAQDPYNIGYMSVDIVYDALQGDAVPKEADTGSWFYNRDNIGKRDISRLLYD